MSESKNLSRYREIFNWIKNQSKYNYTNKQIADWSGVDPSKISRFLTGKRDLKAGDFFCLLESMPEAFQEQFWCRYNPTHKQIVDLAIVIEDMDLADLGNLLQLIGAELDRRNN